MKRNCLLASLLKFFVQEMRLLCFAWPRNLKTYGFCISGEHLFGMEARFSSRDQDPKIQEYNEQEFEFFLDTLYMCFACVFYLDFFTCLNNTSAYFSSFYEEKTLFLMKVYTKTKKNLAILRKALIIFSLTHCS